MFSPILSDFAPSFHALSNSRHSILSHFPQLGGMNSLLSIEHAPSIPLVSKLPTLILGMDVSHGSPGHSDVPSIAAVINIFSAFLSAVPLVICA